MRISPAQSVALRFGAVMCVLGALVCFGVALFTDSTEPTGASVTVVDDPTDIALPAPGFLGSEVTVYGASDGGASPAELGCRLTNADGREQSTAKMSSLAAVTSGPVEVDGAQLQPLFSVSGYSAGWRVSCDQAASATPMALSAPSTFGSNAALVRAAAGGFGVILLVVGVTGWFVFRPRRAG